MFCITLNALVLAYACGYIFTVILFTRWKFIDTAVALLANNAVTIAFTLHLCIALPPSPVSYFMCAIWRHPKGWATHTFQFPCQMPEAHIPKLNIIYLIISAKTRVVNACSKPCKPDNKSWVTHLNIGTFQSTSIAHFVVEIKCIESHFLRTDSTYGHFSGALCFSPLI